VNSTTDILPFRRERWGDRSSADPVASVEPKGPGMLLVERGSAYRTRGLERGRMPGTLDSNRGQNLPVALRLDLCRPQSKVDRAVSPRHPDGLRGLPGWPAVDLFQRSQVQLLPPATK